MKKFELLGRSLSKDEQKKVVGGYFPPEGCTATYSGCDFNEDGFLQCDYWESCSNGTSRPLCGYECMNPGDGMDCLAS